MYMYISMHTIGSREQAHNKKNVIYIYIYVYLKILSFYGQCINVHRSTRAEGHLGTQTRQRFTGGWLGQKPQGLCSGPNQAQPPVATKICRGVDGTKTADLTSLGAVIAWQNC